jgi:hypothetical protein
MIRHRDPLRKKTPRSFVQGVPVPASKEILINCLSPDTLMDLVRTQAKNTGILVAFWVRAAGAALALLLLNFSFFCFLFFAFWCVFLFF